MSQSMPQSTNHVLMIEPMEFYANPQTAKTNAYQEEGGAENNVILAAALEEYHAFKDKLAARGVKVTQGQGIKGSPDMIFPNWFFTHASGELILCPMLNENRRAERTDEVISILEGMYNNTLDWTEYEGAGRALESTASIVSDHVNRVCYSGLSARTDKELAKNWAAHRGYEIVFFETLSHTGIPVYHTDCVMWIGSTLAGVCDTVIQGEGRARVVQSLEAHRAVVRFSAEQLKAFCGNALEVVGEGGKKYLAISQGAVDSLDADQLALIEQHFEGVISSPLATMERYGGGSARCMLAELF